MYLRCPWALHMMCASRKEVLCKSWTGAVHLQHGVQNPFRVRMRAPFSIFERAMTAPAPHQLSRTRQTNRESETHSSQKPRHAHATKTCIARYPNQSAKARPRRHMVLSQHTIQHGTHLQTLRRRDVAGGIEGGIKRRGGGGAGLRHVVHLQEECNFLYGPRATGVNKRV